MSMTRMMGRSYSELITLPTFEERFQYLRLDGTVGIETFGSKRYVNQRFYKQSYEWRAFRRQIIIRDMGCDLGIEDREIVGRIIIHHINPICLEDLDAFDVRMLLNPENAICVSHNTHNAIHYGDDSLLFKEPIIRTKYDTCPWRKL